MSDAVDVLVIATVAEENVVAFQSSAKEKGVISEVEWGDRGFEVD